jgi:HAD superfamily hydrolase (TIGR01549 family)
VTLSYGHRTLGAVLFDLDDVLVPFHTPAAWQWAWRPQGPVLGDRRVRAAVRRSLRSWDRRRWLGLTGKAPPADLAALRGHLAETLAAIAGHSLPEAETEAVVRRVLHPAGEVERFPDVGPALERLKAKEVRWGIVTSLPSESARWLLHRTGLPEALLLRTGDPPGPTLPDPAAFHAALEGLGAHAEDVAFVGDLFWSDVRAAGRAGLASVLLDRYDVWPKVQVGRMGTLDGLEAVLASGGSPPGGEGDDAEERRAVGPRNE